MAVIGTVRTIKQAAWIGWKIESNWTDPLIFSVFYIVRPLSGLLIAGFIFLLGSSVLGSFSSEFFTYIFIGNALFSYVIQITMEMSWLIHEERARYEVLKHIYISPNSLGPYIFGRGLIAALGATVSVILTFVLGFLIFDTMMGIRLNINLATINYPTLTISVILGIVNLVFIGYVLAAINLVSSKLQFTLGEYVSGVFFLFGGVIFPPTILPPLAAHLSTFLPVTHFLNAARASFGIGTADLLGSLELLSVATVATVSLGIFTFRLAERRARSLGLLDRKSEY